MKHKLFFSSAALAMLLLTSPALAQGQGQNSRASSTNSRPAASTTERRLDLKLDIVQRQAARASRTFTNVLGNLESIAGRLESRIAKVKAEGGAVADAENFLAEAKTHIVLAKEKIALFATTNLSAGDLKTNFGKIRTIASEAKSHIRDVHTNLMKAVRALRPGQANRSATSTATTTAE